MASAHECLADEQCRAAFDNGADVVASGIHHSLEEEVERKYFPSRYPYQPFGDPLEKRPGYSPSEAREHAKERESSWQRQREQGERDEAERRRQEHRAAHREQDERREEERQQRMRERQQRENERRQKEKELEASFDVAPDSSLKIDAADPRNKLTGKAGVVRKMFASNGQMVGGIGGSKEQHHGIEGNSGTLTFSGIRVLCTGLHTLTFHYVTHGDRGAYMRVNGEDSGFVEFKSTGGWTTIRRKAVHNVTLVGECSGVHDGMATCPGTESGNSITVYNGEGWCADLDMLEVSVGEGQEFDIDSEGDPQMCPPPRKKVSTRL